MKGLFKKRGLSQNFKNSQLNVYSTVSGLIFQFCTSENNCSKKIKIFAFGIDFAGWIKAIIKNQESCIINGGNTTKNFKLERDPRQGDPISPYLFVLVLEIFLYV